MEIKNTRNVFLTPEVASEYDAYYQTETGKIVDNIEKEIVWAHLKELSKTNWLELGCGTGHWTKFFSESKFQITAVDNSEAMLKIARSKSLKNVEFLNADATRLPFSDNHFSGIVSITMLEFVDDLKGALNEIDRVLKPGGTLVLGCLNALSEPGKNKNNDPVFQHARFFTPNEIKEIFTRFGNPRISAGVYFSPDFELLDGTEKQSTAEPAFIAASVQKQK
ncbi:Methyltransferase domain-containing protein [Tangfeifania diversioriginum]|uniref:Methyltransferase domain-containing protein n=1 Tax=Tangfeifania diversioriginum TaxID=1168035 RepID=A0A1M6MU78_9BACT|nr:class I SAM-dependent methyltransferase [Tangfeifania diversioriginum]SHJ86823.1 Methyltransferase domain-containing protein [Tangfeifania diversioriginum]